MYKKQRALKDKGIIIMSVISVIALCILVGLIVADNMQKTDSDIRTVAENRTSEASATSPIKDELATAETLPEESYYTEPYDSEEAGAQIETESQTETETESTTIETESSDASVNAPVTSFGFSNQSILVWPVETNDIIIDFSMDTTTYFATLDMYKTSDAVCIRSEVNSPVYACADGVVTANSYNEEVGHYICVDLGNEYEVTYGQLKNMAVDEGTTVKEGDLIGYISEPTKYYSVEGANLYLKMTCGGVPIDPSDFLNYSMQ